MGFCGICLTKVSKRKNFNRILNNNTTVLKRTKNYNKAIRMRNCKGKQIGKHPEIEVIQFDRIRIIYKCGSVIESWTLLIEGREICRDLCPNIYTYKYHDPIIDQHILPLSSIILDNKVSLISISFLLEKYKRVKKSENKSGWINLISKFPAETRAFQLSQINDPIHGFISPHWEHTHDQISITLCSSLTTTVEQIGEDIMYDCTRSNNNKKYYITLTQLHQYF